MLGAFDSPDAWARDRVILTSEGEFALTRPIAGDECILKLDDKEVRRYDCRDSNAPRVLAKFKNVGNYPEILVIQESPKSRECRGGALYFAGVRKSGHRAEHAGSSKVQRVDFSERIPYCGGSVPQLKRLRDKVRMTLRDGWKGRGEAPILEERWSFGGRGLQKE